MPKIESARAFGMGISSVKRYRTAASKGRWLVLKQRPGSKLERREEAFGGEPRGAPGDELVREARGLAVGMRSRSQ